MQEKLNSSHVLNLVEEKCSKNVGMKKAMNGLYHTIGQVGISIVILNQRSISLSHKGEVIKTILVIPPSSAERAVFQADRIMNEIDAVIKEELSAVVNKA